MTRASCIPLRPGERPTAALAGLALAAACLLGAACNADPAPNMISRQDQSNTPPMTPGPGPSTAGSPAPPLPTAGRGGTGGASVVPPAPTPDGGSAGTPADAGSDAEADAGPELTVCADEDAGIDLGPDAGAITCLAIGDLHVQYKASDTNPTDQQIKPHFNLVNHGTESVPLSELKIRYWYTRDGNAEQAFNCDYALIGCGVVSATFSAVQRQGADQYVEISFASGQLGPGGQTGEIQTRYNNVGWAAYDESNDYSFEPGHAAFADWYKTTLYRRGQLVWGAEPPDIP